MHEAYTWCKITYQVPGAFALPERVSCAAHIIQQKNTHQNFKNHRGHIADSLLPSTVRASILSREDSAIFSFVISGRIVLQIAHYPRVQQLVGVFREIKLHTWKTTKT